MNNKKINIKQRNVKDLPCVIDCGDEYYIWWDLYSWCISKNKLTGKGDKRRVDISWHNSITESLEKVICYKIADDLNTSELISIKDRLNQLEKIYNSQINLLKDNFDLMKGH